MAKEMETLKDEGLQGNETIEEAILGLQKEPTPELPTVSKTKKPGRKGERTWFMTVSKNWLHTA